MNDFILYLQSSNYSFLLSNVFGLYLPLFISLSLLIKFHKDILNKTNLVLFVIGVFLTFITVEIIQLEKLNQIQLTNYFGVFFIFYFKFIKNEKIDLASIFVLSFLSLLIADIYYAYTYFSEKEFLKYVGGAGIVDGLLFDPSLCVIGSYILNAIRERRLKIIQKRKTA